MTKACRIDQHGGHEVLRFVDIEVGAPGPGEALVRQTAVGVNFIDVYHRNGLYRLPALPSGIGLEAAGVVEAIGDGVTQVQVGQRVAYAGGAPGAYAQARLQRADVLVPLPDAIADETAAAMMLKGMTVEYLIRRTFPVQAGQTVLFHAAAGGVGLIACQWLKHLGATVIGTVGSERKAELARAAGATHVIDYTREDVVARVRELTDGKGVPVVYDSVGKATFMQSIDCLRPRGMMVAFGNASGKPEPLDTLLLSQKGALFLTRPSLMAYTATRQELLGSASALFDVVASGAVTINVNHRWPLEQAADAHRALEQRETTGSIVLEP